MTDISKLVTYDQTFPVEIRRPDNGEKLGLVIHMVSSQSQRGVRAAKLVESRRWSAVFADGGDGKLTPEQTVDFIDQSRDEVMIACIDHWEWGGLEFGDLGADPECTEANRRYLIEHPNADWIKAQIKVAMDNLTNFFSDTVKPSARKSRAK